MAADTPIVIAVMVATASTLRIMWYLPYQLAEVKAARFG
jgi:hypothetical protein